jgi:hypothetical protein
MDVPEIYPGYDAAIQSRLVADQDNENMVISQPSQSLQSVRVELELSTVLDVVRPIFIDNAIPVQKQKWPRVALWGLYPDEHRVFPFASYLQQVIFPFRS